nr:hypothetical protein [Azospirillum sp. 412522]
MKRLRHGPLGAGKPPSHPNRIGSKVRSESRASGRRPQRRQAQAAE